jgi:hypothetical protein
VTVPRRQRWNNDRTGHAVVIAYMRELRGLLLATSPVLMAVAVLVAVLAGR